MLAEASDRPYSTYVLEFISLRLVRNSAPPQIPTNLRLYHDAPRERIDEFEDTTSWLLKISTTT